MPTDSDTNWGEVVQYAKDVANRELLRLAHAANDGIMTPDAVTREIKLLSSMQAAVQLTAERLS
jgi:hypothetical protein